MQQDVYATNNSIRFNRNLGPGSTTLTTTTITPSTSGQVLSAIFTNINFPHSPGIFFLGGGTPTSATVVSTTTLTTVLNVSFQYASTDTTIIYATIVRSTNPSFTSRINLSTGSQTDVTGESNSLWCSSLSAGSQVTCSMIFCDIDPPYSQTYYYGIQINTNGSGSVNSSNIIVTGG